MKIAVIGGKEQAEFIVKKFIEEKHKVIVVNNDKEFGEKIAKDCGVTILKGEPTKTYFLDKAKIYGADLLIALCEKDTDNYVVCKLAQKVYEIKKVICIVKNPNNVATFKQLGINFVISSTYLLYSQIKQESTLEDLVKTLKVSDSQIIISEIKILKNYEIAGKQLKDVSFPKEVNICAILRNGISIIPKGSTEIQAQDKILVLSSLNDQNEIINFIQKRKIENE